MKAQEPERQDPGVSRGTVLRTVSPVGESCTVARLLPVSRGLPLFRILVVDDEPDLRYVQRMIFERAGYEVFDAPHGAAALELVRRHRPDLVVTDMMMPVMSGAELIRQLHADPATAGIPIIASTADAYLANGANVVLAKPYRPEQLLAAVTTLLKLAAEPG